MTLIRAMENLAHYAAGNEKKSFMETWNGWVQESGTPDKKYVPTLLAFCREIAAMDASLLIMIDKEEWDGSKPYNSLQKKQ